MDNWGDPWADDAVSVPPPKQDIKTPPPLPSAPVFLNGFLDDAQWGTTDHDEGYGGWTAGPEISEPDTTPSTGTTAVQPESKRRQELRNGEGDEARIFDGGWDSHTDEQDALVHLDNVVSEASDSATTVQAEATSPIPFSTEPHGDDDSSTRPSTSPSDVSHTEAHIDSPRTSFEDERAIHKSLKAETTSIEHSIDGGNTDDNTPPSPKAEEEGSLELEEDDDFRDFEDTDIKTELSTPDESNTPKVNLEALSNIMASKTDSGNTAEQDPVEEDQLQALRSSRALFRPDISLVEQIYPVPKATGDIGPPPEDPISTTAERKAWYRLTRRQTMREFNNGTDDDNYVRVTWMNSRIRSETGKIVGRWATEDRMSARGQVAAGTFFWDQPAAQAESTTLDRSGRKRPSLPLSTQVRPVAHLQSARPETFGGAPAQFNWSTAAEVSHSPREQSSPVSPGYRSTSSPLTAKPNAVSRVRGHAQRSISVDLNRRLSIQKTHKRATSLANASPFTPLSPGISSRNSVAVDLLSLSEPVQASPAVIPLPIPSSISSTPKASLDMGFASNPSLSTNPESTQVDTKVEDCSPAATATIAEDDDEWGEMVQSPSKGEFPDMPPIQAPSSTPQPPQSTPSNQFKAIRPLIDTTPTSKHASPIVRLKGVVSPTTARFKFNNFIPPSTETGPIGREVLRKTTPEKPRIELMSESAIEWNKDPSNGSSLDNGPTDEFSNFEYSIPQPSSPRDSKEQSSTDPFSIFESSPPAPPAAPTATPPPSDPFSSADFSIFDSLPAAPPSQTQPHPDPSDPFSIFETTNPAPIHEPTSISYAHPEQRETTPPPKIPLTGASDAEQRRKAEEDEVVREIVDGLPDLKYMLLR